VLFVHPRSTGERLVVGGTGEVRLWCDLTPVIEYFMKTFHIAKPSRLRSL
jgi:hypothetical protein